jgi:hypothetical protein
VDTYQKNPKAVSQEICKQLKVEMGDPRAD